MHVDLLLLPGFFATGATVTLDAFSVANLVIHDLQVTISPFEARLLSKDGNPVMSNLGLAQPVHGGWDDAVGDVLMPFGVGMADPERLICGMASPDADVLADRLRDAHGAGATLAASCSSTFLLAQTGLLNGGRATTSWWLTPLFQQTYPLVHLDCDALITEHSRVLCAGAAMAQLDLALHLIRRHAGMDVARTTARYLVIDEGRVSQAPYVIADHLTRHDPVVAKAEAWIRERLSGQIDVSALATAVGVSGRTLNRRFQNACSMSPSQYIQRARAEAGARLLRESDRSISQVAEAVGYAEEGALRRAFSRYFDCSPTAYRKRLRRVVSSTS